METILGKTEKELTDLAVSIGLPKFAGKQIANWLYVKRAKSFTQMTNLPSIARQKLTDLYSIGRSEPVAHAVSADGTKKYLFAIERTGNKHCFVETVYIPEDDRATLCVSTQAGCKMGCKFCMTGSLGFQTQLTAAEILNQIFSIPEAQDLTNIVFMGEGEPGDNADNVIASVNALTSSWGCGWSPRRITISSVGYLPGLKQLIEFTECHIAISLHNPFHAERQEIMPIDKVYPIDSVLELLSRYDWRHQRRLSFEYICFGGQNDTIRHANALKRILHPFDCRVNLIKFHKSPDEGNRHDILFADSSPKQMEWLKDYLTDNGITTTIRRSRGEDILAACGMLVNALVKEN